MKFRTTITLKPELNQIDYNSRVLMLGSCFSESIFNKLSYYKFKAQKNPFGIMYSPKAIENLVLNIINKKTYEAKDLFELNERWHCFDAHSDLSNPNKNDMLDALNSQIIASNKALKEATSGHGLGSTK